MPRIVTFHYYQLSKDQVEILFNFFLTSFYYDIGHAQGSQAKLKAIAKLIQRLEWLHPVRDGCGRTDWTLLNFLLTVYGFNPALFRLPFVSSCKGIDEWTSLLMQGIQDWQKETTE